MAHSLDPDPNLFGKGEWREGKKGKEKEQMRHDSFS
jgi:hypothetical protein